MSERYQVTTPDEYGDASVLDTLTNEFVQTNSGHLYVAPKANAQWTADSLNKVHADLPEETTGAGLVDEDGDDYTPEQFVTRETAPIVMLSSDSTLSYPEKIWMAVTAPRKPEPAPVEDLADWEEELVAPEPMVPLSLLEAEQEKSVRRHQRTLEYAGQLGKATADLSAVRSRLIGLTRGMIPSMRERGVAPYRTPEGALFHALDLIEGSLNETLAFLTERIEEHRP